MKVLIIQTAFIGDVILATSLIESLAEAQPNASITLLLRKGNESLLANNPHIKEVLIWDKKIDRWRSLRKLIRTVREEKFDQLINLQRFGSTGFLTWRSGAKHKAGFSKNPFSFCFDVRIDHQIGNRSDVDFQHEIDRNYALVQHLAGIGDRPVKRSKLYPSQADFQKSDTLVSAPFVTMAPSSVWYTKQFPKEKWIELIGKTNEQVILLGGPDDKALCEEIRQASSPEKVKNLAGELSFLQSAALMTKAEMNFVNDSAPLHMASSMNAPVTAFFCSTIPQFGFGPQSDNSRIIQIDQELECRPCGLHGHAACPKGHFKCAKLIDLREFKSSPQG